MNKTDLLVIERDLIHCFLDEEDESSRSGVVPPPHGDTRRVFAIFSFASLAVKELLNLGLILFGSCVLHFG